MMNTEDRLFTWAEINQYLERIQLTYKDIEKLSQSDRLHKLHVSHILNVPFDATAVHLPSKWWSLSPHITESSQVNLNYHQNSIQPELVSVKVEDTFNNIIRERRGGYCWSLNSCFARLLLSLNYQVSQLPARVFLHRNQDPTVAGYSWGPLCHECLLVDTESGKFLCDVGFGGGSPAYPIPFEENLETESLTPLERFKLVRENCPALDASSTGQAEGYTLQRWCGEWWSPCYHFYLSPMVFKDIKMFNWFSTTHAEAPFKSRLVVTILKSDGSRRSLVCSIDENGVQSEIKLSTRKNVNAEESEISFINPTYSDLYQTLKREFRWGPT